MVGLIPDMKQTSHAIGGSLLAAFVLLFVGCTETNYDPFVQGPVDRLECASIGSFGPGVQCIGAGGAVDLSLCGDPAIVTCSEGRVCFSDALYTACSCASDADCGGYTTYVNQLRSSLGQQPLPNHCELGICTGDAD